MTTQEKPTARKRICHIITRLELGGAQQNTLYTLAHLDRNQFEPMLIAGRGGYLDGEAERIHDLPHVFLPELVREVDPWRDVRALEKMVTILRQWRPDLVHTHSSKAGILGRWAAHMSGVPVVLHTIHGFGFHPEQASVSRWFFEKMESLTSPITTRFLAVSEANLGKGLELGLFSMDRVELVRSGVQISSFAGQQAKSGFRASLGIPLQAPVAGMVGCLKPQKAPLDWVRVAAQVRKQIPAAHFLLIGDGELRRRVEREVARMELQKHFHLLGWRRDLPKILSEIQVFVLTSLWEGLPRVIPEAMAAGLPVVATRVDGTPEVVWEGETGFLTDPHDVETMSKRIVFLLAHPDRARRMGEVARTRIQTFDIDDMVRHQERIYQSLLAQRFRAAA